MVHIFRVRRAAAARICMVILPTYGEQACLSLSTGYSTWGPLFGSGIRSMDMYPTVQGLRLWNALPSVCPRSVLIRIVFLLEFLLVPFTGSFPSHILSWHSLVRGTPFVAEHLELLSAPLFLGFTCSVTFLGASGLGSK